MIARYNLKEEIRKRLSNVTRSNIETSEAIDEFSLK